MESVGDAPEKTVGERPLNYRNDECRLDIPPLQRRNAEQERAYLEVLLEPTGDGIYDVNTDGCCTFINRAGAAMLGYSRDEVIGHNAHWLIPRTTSGRIDLRDRQLSDL